MLTSVRAISDTSVPGAGRTNGHDIRGVQDNAPCLRMTYSRLIGALFLVGFLFYGVGAALVTSVTGVPDFLSTISAHQTTLLIGAFLMLLNTVVDDGKVFSSSQSWRTMASYPRWPTWPSLLS